MRSRSLSNCPWPLPRRPASCLSHWNEGMRDFICLENRKWYWHPIDLIFSALFADWCICFCCDAGLIKKNNNFSRGQDKEVLFWGPLPTFYIMRINCGITHNATEEMESFFVILCFNNGIFHFKVPMLLQNN